MTDFCPLFIGFFPENVPEFDSFVSRNCHFEEFFGLFHVASRLRPNEPKKVAPAHEIVPRKPSMHPQKALEQRMDVVDRVHWVAAILEAFRFGCFVDLAPQPKLAHEKGMGIVAVMDQKRAWLYAPLECSQGLFA